MTERPNEVDCTTVFGWMYAFFDHELDEDTFVVVQHHLNACEDCEDTYAVEERVRITVRRSCCAQAPDSLRARIEALRTIAREA